MAPTCALCPSRAQILRPKDHTRLCAPCFTTLFENETYATITSSSLFYPGERIAIGASGGKDSCVLASVLSTLNARHALGLELILLSIDEGITGYRDHSLDAVRRNADALGLPLHILSYQELYGWSMDQVVAQIGKKGNCTYCGVFRRQALDRGASRLGVRHVVTGHNADDVAETVIMNLLRGDVARLGRGTSIVTRTPGEVEEEGAKVKVTDVKRSKPLMYAYEKEIVLYAHHKKLDYFSTECIYSPEAFRGSARTLIKNLERIRPESILDIVKSGIDMARLVPDAEGQCAGACKDGSKKANTARIAVDEEDDGNGGCGSGPGAGTGGQMADMEKRLVEDAKANEMGIEVDVSARPADGSAPTPVDGQRDDAHETRTIGTVPIRRKKKPAMEQKPPVDSEKRLGKCERCGYLSSQRICKACVLLEGLNKARPKAPIAVELNV
ncbi:Cytoplasmic tRNA 2-thiolation protein 1 [Sphaceloma murrayae]|uniref:Cytoplasmic tRNA 2-thiolation protein 1 n=1 Tax=Sphaceloma murrayae TaxID=2082308 RepID=A0A2K1R0V1_9PEZI|nr:Cytoplasmic tRNA 2-thiolation protein 1 [Sphaceloma murrayae]